MQRIRRFTTSAHRGLIASVLGAALLLTACGGGGGGPGPNLEGSNPTPTPTMPNSTSTGPVTVPGTPTAPMPPAASATVPVGLQAPAVYSRQGEGGNDAPRVVIDAAGNAISLWRRQVTSLPNTYELLARRYVVGSGWQTIEVLATDDPSDDVREIQAPVQLTMNPATGAAMAVWVEKRETGNAAGELTSNVMARAYSPATGWRSAAMIDNDQPMLRSDVALAMDANGNAMAVWSRYVNLRVPVFASRYTAGGGWSAPVRIEDSNELGIGGNGMLVTFLSNGNALAVWNSARNGGGTGGGVRSAIWGNQYTVGSGWGTNAPVMSYTENLSLGGARSLTADQNGNALLTFEQQLLIPGQGRYELNLFSKRYSGGAWGADSTALPVGVPYSCVNCPSVYGGSVQINAQGQAVATWELRNANDKNVIWAARSTNGSTWEATQLNANIEQFTQRGEFAQAGIDDQGNISVVWSAVSQVTSKTDINYARYTTGSGWADTSLLETYDTTSEQPQIAMNAKGNAMTVWMLFENAVGTILTSRYFGSGR